MFGVGFCDLVGGLDGASDIVEGVNVQRSIMVCVIGRDGGGNWW